MNSRRLCVVLLAIVAAFVAAHPNVMAQSAALTVWRIPHGESFPAGVAMDARGWVYVALASGREVIGLDSTTSTVRSWGVGEGPAAVAVVDQAVFCTVQQANQIVWFHPDSLGVTTAVLPFADLGPRELLRGAETSEGEVLLWMTSWEQPAVLQLVYDPATEAPGVVGEPSDTSVSSETMVIEETTLTVDYEAFPYNVAVLPDPYAITAVSAANGLTKWELPLPDEYAVYDLAPADDGSVWISFGTPFLLRLDPDAQSLQELETIPNAAILNGLYAAPDGSIWFSNLVEGGIGHLDLSLGFSETWRIPGAEDIYDLVLDEHGALWYTDRIADTIGRLDIATGEVTIYPLPVDSEPLNLLVDDAGHVWFCAGLGNYIGRLVFGD